MGAPLTRRRLLASGVGGALGVAVAGYELVDHGVLPGKGLLDRLEGACSVSTPPEGFVARGPQRSGSFYSRARGRTVGYTIAYPPGYAPPLPLPLGISLHGFGGNHTSGLGGITLSQALAGRGMPPVALVAVDGGGLYWNAHPGDDPMAMIVEELLPMCRRLGLGRPPHAVGTIGISMGGYGALLLAEKHPQLIAAVSAVSPAIWTSYAQARAANGGAYASAADFADDDVVTHASALAGIPVRITSGSDDPFHPGVAALARRLPSTATVIFPPGCHDGAFFASQQHAALAFLASHLQ